MVRSEWICSNTTMSLVENIFQVMLMWASLLVIFQIRIDPSKAFMHKIRENDEGVYFWWRNTLNVFLPPTCYWKIWFHNQKKRWQCRGCHSSKWCQPYGCVAPFALCYSKEGLGYIYNESKVCVSHLLHEIRSKQDKEIRMDLMSSILHPITEVIQAPKVHDWVISMSWWV